MVVLNLNTGFGIVTVCALATLTTGRFIVDVGVDLICVFIVDRFSIADFVSFLLCAAARSL